MNDLSFASIHELAPQVRTGKLSPVRLVEIALERIERIDPALNSFYVVMKESALKAAHSLAQEVREGKYRGPLHGIPVGLKDLFDVVGEKTTGGSTILKNNVARADATVTRQLREAGAIIIGKLNMVEFAMGATGMNPHYGPARNPWDTARITCGSSGGSGAAVAAGLCVAALGSDTGGSVRMPAAVCGIAGLKPTYGLISRHGVLDLSWTCDHVGPMARRVVDCAYLMNALAGHDPLDPASAREFPPDFAAGIGQGLRGIRVGVPQHYFFDGVDPEIEAAVRGAVELMAENGSQVRPVAMPWVSSGRAINMTVMMAEAVSVHEGWLKNHREQYSGEVRARLEAAQTMSALDYIRGQRARRWFNEKMAAAMRDVDVLVTPTVAIQTPTIEECTPPPGANEGRAGGTLGMFTGVFNTTGMPSLSVTCGYTRAGMPIGMMISGKPFEDGTVLRVGDAYERLAGHFQRHPPVTPGLTA
ncbi:MAG: amidase [Chloroflexi bacterium]|nr:amidase [Chloroflexota bacterium]